MHPTFIMSTERSGSNLVRKMLGAHPDIAAPPPAHHLTHLSVLLPYYGPLGRRNNLRKLVDDAVEMTQVEDSHLEWSHRLEADEILERVETPSLPGVLEAMYELVAEREEAVGWACKENSLFEHAFDLRDTIRQAKFVYLCRDGRDVAVSMQNVPTHDEHVYYIAREWLDEQLDCLRVLQELEPRGHATLLKYEDLIEEPERELRRICEFVDIDYHPRMLGFHKLEETQKAADKTVFWENLSQPVMSDNKGKFYEELTERERKIFESQAAAGLDLLGYPREFAGEDLELTAVEMAKIDVENWVKRKFQERERLQESGREERDAMLSRVRGRRMEARPLEAFGDETVYR